MIPRSAAEGQEVNSRNADEVFGEDNPSECGRRGQFEAHQHGGGLCRFERQIQQASAGHSPSVARFHSPRRYASLRLARGDAAKGLAAMVV